MSVYNILLKINDKLVSFSTYMQSGFSRKRKLKYLCGIEEQQREFVENLDKNELRETFSIDIE